MTSKKGLASDPFSSLIDLSSDNNKDLSVINEEEVEDHKDRLLPHLPSGKIKINKIKDFDHTFLFIKHLNSGGNGDIYLVHYKDNYYALKLILLQDYEDGTTNEKSVLLQAKILSLLQDKCNDGFLCFYGLYKGKYNGLTYLGHLLEYIEGTDLYTLVIEDKKSLSPVELFYLFRQLINIVYYLHAANLVHRDIKVENIMISKDKLTLIDTDDACSLSSSKLLCYKNSGTYIYQSPSILALQYINPEYYYLLKPSDIWAIGIVMFILAYKRYPFQDKYITPNINSIEAMERVYSSTDGMLSFSTSSHPFTDKDKEFVRILNSLLIRNDTERPTAKKILSELNDISSIYSEKK